MRSGVSAIVAWRRALWRWHLWAGVVIAPFLAIISLTGALYAFAPQLEPLFSKHLYFHDTDVARESLASADRMIDRLESDYPDHHVEALDIHKDLRRNWQFQMHNEVADERLVAFFNPATGELAGVQESGAGVLRFILRVHRTLLAGEVGRFLTEAATSWGIVTLLTGLVMWWPKVWSRVAGVWSFRRDESGKVNKRDRHAVLGIYTLPLALMLMVSGLLFTPVWGKLWIVGNALTGGLPDFYLNPPTSVLQDTDGADRLSLDQALEYAVEGADFSGHSLRLVIPDEPYSAIHIHTNLGEAVFGFHSVFIDQYSGQILSQSTHEDFSLQTTLTLLFYPIHTGTIFGWPTQLIAMMGALMISLLSMTGLALWWKRGRRFSTPEAAMPRVAAWVATIFAICLPMVGLSILAVWIMGCIGRLRRRRPNP